LQLRFAEKAIAEMVRAITGLKSRMPFNFVNSSSKVEARHSFAASTASSSANIARRIGSGSFGHAAAA
jgi:hypothetical protein